MLSRSSLQMIFITAAVLLAFGCSRTPQYQAEIRHYAAIGDYDAAALRLNKLYGSSLANDADNQGDRLTRKHGLLWSLDRGILATLAGNYQDAFVLLSEASTLVEEFRSKWNAGGIAREFRSSMINETQSNYEGNAYEHIQVEFWRSLNELIHAQQRAGLTNDDPAVLDRVAADQHYQNAISFARKMVLNQIQETQDAANDTMWRRTYYDDPFARLYGGALMLTVPRDQRAGSDLQFADVMLKQAWTAYGAERETMAGQKAYRYETAPREQNQALITLLHRVGNAYDASGWAQWAERHGVPPAQPIRVDGAQITDPALAADHGMVLVLYMADLVSHPVALDINAVTGTIPLGYTRPRHPGEQVATFRIGAVAMVARGPGAEVVNSWPPLPLPPQLTEALAPGGLAIIGTAIPVHAPDTQLAETAHSLIPHNDTQHLDVPLQVLSDLDAYARATLKDEQPLTLIRALTRTAVKQLAAILAAREAEKEGGQLAGFLVGLTGSSLATWSEVADVRGALLLPDTIQGSLIDLPAGKHHLQLSSAGQMVDLGEINVPAGRLVIVPVRGFPNPPPPVNQP